ncbi:MAG: hypothetical protein ACE5I1_08275, partial [bacterium]
MSRKKKGNLHDFFTISFLALFFITPIFAQQDVSRTFEDGSPVFTRLDSIFAVRADSIIQLNFTKAKSSEREDFSLHLDGVDRVFNSTAQPLDFIPLPDRPDLYMITDAFARRVFVVRADNGNEVAEFRGPNEPENALTTPVASRAFLQGSARKLFITDQAKPRVLKLDYDDKSTVWIYPPAGAPAIARLIEPSAAVSVRAVADTSEVIICDTGNNRVLHVSVPDSTPGAFQIVWT